MTVWTAVATYPSGDADVTTYQWGPMVPGDTANPITDSQWADRSVQIDGTFGGATVTFQGSNTPGGAGNYYTLSDPQGNALSLTAAALKQISEMTGYVKPVISGGTGSQVTITLTVRRTQPLRV